MAKVEIVPELRKQIISKFKQDSERIFLLMKSLANNPKKGDYVANVGNIAVKEIRYNKFRFYFIVDKYKITFLPLSKLGDLLIKFIRMSEKKDQQKVIEEIKNFLRMVRDQL